MRPYVWIVIAGLSGALAVALGAYGAHGLGADEMLRQRVHTAVSYQLWHTLGMVAASLLAMLRPQAGRIAQGAAFLFLVGIVCFSGSLYVSALTGGATTTGVAPAGGTAFIAGWLTLAIAAWLGRRDGG
jgi:uncharacterized membrane protein YgdD (TMEM256/DUF423 family)